MKTPMTKALSANLEMALILPLGVVANQLMKIEADLRLLNMRALDVVNEDGAGRHTGLIEARLETINDALDSIRGLVADIDADIHPWSADKARSTFKEHTARIGAHLAIEDDALSPSDVNRTKHSNRKSRSDRDD